MTERQIAQRVVETSGVVCRLIEEWESIHEPTIFEQEDAVIRDKIARYFAMLNERIHWVNAAANCGLHKFINAEA